MEVLAGWSAYRKRRALLLQPIIGEDADTIAKECPGLFEVAGTGKTRKAIVKPAREHPQLLEKVRKWSVHDRGLPLTKILVRELT